MKFISTFMVLVFMFLVLSLKSLVSANEGRVIMQDTNVACEAISVWQDNRFVITGRCQGLVYPYASTLDNYVLWARNSDGTIERIDEVQKGIISDSTTKTFNSMFITAESDSSPKIPSSTIVVSGSLSDLAFDTQTITASSTPQPGTVSASKTPVPTATASPSPLLKTPIISRGSIITLIILGLIIVVITFIVRRR